MTENKFNGFSHDEILKITGMKNPSQRPPLELAKQALRNHPGIRRQPDKMYRQADQLRKQQSSASNNPQKKSKSTPTESLPTLTPTEADDVRLEESLNLERPLSNSLVDALYYGQTKALPPAATTNLATLASSCSDTTTNDDSSILKLSSLEADTPPLPSSKESLNTDSPFKGISLKDFEQHRKLIEEQNKQKKQMLYQAIEQHTQKTAAECKKIEEIRHELSKLESDLALDVALLRKQIDHACIHFATVEKQYVKIEAQFLKAKMDLHNASEKKELLTEHLCTVIAHNEDRKAQKLTELMQKVGLASTDEPEMNDLAGN